MQIELGTHVRTSAQIDANCAIDHEVVGGEAFFSFADGAVSLHFTDERAFRNFMAEAVAVLARFGSDGLDDAVNSSD
ncbi:hypothetical protein [Saccharothrix hoggarensis]|uniref:Uncharacterized protein n=1 Tax=Saccharothrix hoggarensis TaxID=913853 RepID=A0ABW3R092_9PSEU